MQFVEANGAKIPAIGFGYLGAARANCARLVEQAVRLGYRSHRHRQAYDNEREVGEACVRRESGDTNVRDDQVWTTHFAPNDLERSVKESLAKLHLSEVDLLLLHWPNPRVPLAETLGALAHVSNSAWPGTSAVSNFTVALIEEAVAHVRNLWCAIRSNIIPISTDGHRVDARTPPQLWVGRDRMIFEPDRTPEVPDMPQPPPRSAPR